MKNSNIEKVKKIIEESGNSFHCTVLDFLIKEGWTVLISPYYNDNVSGKPREIDLIAEKSFVSKSMFGKGCTVNIKLFVECKYVSQNVVFWFHDKDVVKAENLVVETMFLPKDNINTKKHHYLSNNDNVAKLFADGKKSNVENEIFYKALNQSLNAMIYYRDSESIIPTNASYSGKTVNLPVIICNNFSNLYRVDIGLSKEPTKINDNFLLEVNYAYLESSGEHADEYFLIDIVDYKKLKSFLEMLQQEVDVIAEFS
ncbi:MAG: hypothetical protein H8D23_25015 [Candidatus Brocadiales bacterium]|nr:hypothetical protein [Candidatus Brocadiales bacterium]